MLINSNHKKHLVHYWDKKKIPPQHSALCFKHFTVKVHSNLLEKLNIAAVRTIYC